ncbi:hypothetical protein HF086_008688 [Spodoptera exigua]|uniref:PHD-type domain-containing protein n=1 Tax=Spodoptera exigua TaxID=7107 RepID=A0A922MWR2_SPOEX|nr:hypothetical protein HF086_008688 [Spodoptera exigua]
MPNNCGACGAALTDSNNMECSNEKCKKRYDLECLEISTGTFGSYTHAFKKNWICPECVCSKPKVGNSETPIRVNAIKTDINTYTTPMSFVSAQRGSKANFTPTVYSNDSAVLKELREFRSDMVARMDSQAQAITFLLNQFYQTKTELDNVVQIMKVLEEKIDAQQTNDISRDIPHHNTPPTSTFAEIVNQPKTTSKNIHVEKVNKGGATKSAVLRENASYIPNLTRADAPIGIEEEDNESDWKTVQNKKKIYKPPKNVKIGTNTALKGIQATERKKHLHVWRLHPETTIEAITEHVKSVCGPDSTLKIDKIKHKTERDYSSFIIGVSESNFDMLNQAEVWPKNAEFDEWVWFRKPTKRTNNE